MVLKHYTYATFSLTGQHELNLKIYFQYFYSNFYLDKTTKQIFAIAVIIDQSFLNSIDHRYSLKMHRVKFYFFILVKKGFKGKEWLFIAE